MRLSTTLLPLAGLLAQSIYAQAKEIEVCTQVTTQYITNGDFATDSEWTSEDYYSIVTKSESESGYLEMPFEDSTAVTISQTVSNLNVGPYYQIDFWWNVILSDEENFEHCYVDVLAADGDGELTWGYRTAEIDKTGWVNVLGQWSLSSSDSEEVTLHFQATCNGSPGTVQFKDISFKGPEIVCTSQCVASALRTSGELIQDGNFEGDDFDELWDDWGTQSIVDDDAPGGGRCLFISSEYGGYYEMNQTIANAQKGHVYHASAMWKLTMPEVTAEEDLPTCKFDFKIINVDEHVLLDLAHITYSMTTDDSGWMSVNGTWHATVSSAIVSLVIWCDGNSSPNIEIANVQLNFQQRICAPSSSSAIASSTPLKSAVSSTPLVSSTPVSRSGSASSRASTPYATISISIPHSTPVSSIALPLASSSGLLTPLQSASVASTSALIRTGIQSSSSNIISSASASTASGSSPSGSSPSLSSTSSSSIIGSSPSSFTPPGSSPSGSSSSGSSPSRSSPSGFSPSGSSPSASSPSGSSPSSSSPSSFAPSGSSPSGSSPSVYSPSGSSNIGSSPSASFPPGSSSFIPSPSSSFSLSDSSTSVSPTDSIPGPGQSTTTASSTPNDNVTGPPRPAPPASTSAYDLTTPGSDTQLTTSTVFTTQTSTITACPSTVTNCPATAKTTYVTTETIIVSTTVCPVAEGEGSTTASIDDDGSYTSTLLTTRTVTVTSCAATVTNCPARSQTTYTSIQTLVAGTTVISAGAVPTSSNFIPAETGVDATKSTTAPSETETITSAGHETVRATTTSDSIASDKTGVPESPNSSLGSGSSISNASPTESDNDKTNTMGVTDDIPADKTGMPEGNTASTGSSGSGNTATESTTGDEMEGVSAQGAFETISSATATATDSNVNPGVYSEVNTAPEATSSAGTNATGSSGNAGTSGTSSEESDASSGASSASSGASSAASRASSAASGDLQISSTIKAAGASSTLAVVASASSHHYSAATSVAPAFNGATPLHAAQSTLLGLVTFGIAAMLV